MIAKGRYIAVQPNKGHRVALAKAFAHIRYIQHRAGPERESGGREFFDAEQDKVSIREFKNSLRERKQGVLIHKIVLSPDINSTDQQAYTREMMSKLGDKKGLDLVWIATSHWNTRHPHVHVVVQGIDANGRQVRLSKKDYAFLRECGNQYMDREHPLERELAAYEREERNKQSQERRLHVLDWMRRESNELSWVQKKLMREFYEPYNEWKLRQMDEETTQSLLRQTDSSAKDEKPLSAKGQEINLASRRFTADSSLVELRALDRFFTDYPDRGTTRDVLRLKSWIVDREKQLSDSWRREQMDSQSQGKETTKESIVWHKQEFSKDNALETLYGLARLAKANDDLPTNAMPIKDKLKLYEWIEDKDRVRFSGRLEREVDKEAGKALVQERSIASAQQELTADPANVHIHVGEEILRLIRFSLENQRESPTAHRLKQERREAWKRLADAHLDSDLEVIEKTSLERHKADDALELHREQEVQEKLKEREDRDRDIFMDW